MQWQKWSRLLGMVLVCLGWMQIGWLQYALGHQAPKMQRAIKVQWDDAGLVVLFRLGVHRHMLEGHAVLAKLGAGTEDPAQRDQRLAAQVMRHALAGLSIDLGRPNCLSADMHASHHTHARWQAPALSWDAGGHWAQVWAAVDLGACQKTAATKPLLDASAAPKQALILKIGLLRGPTLGIEVDRRLASSDLPQVRSGQVVAGSLWQWHADASEPYVVLSP